MRTTHGYPPNLWAESPDLNPMVAIESYHAHLNADFYSAQPNIYLFVKTLLRQRTPSYVSLASLSQSRPVRKRSPHFCDACTPTLTATRDICPEDTIHLQRVSYRLCPA